MPQINSPVVVITFEGNVRDLVAKNEHTAFASFENGKTTCAVIVPVLNRQQKMAVYKNLSIDFKRYGKILDMNYYKDGMDIVQLSLN